MASNTGTWRTTREVMRQSNGSPLSGLAPVGLPVAARDLGRRSRGPETVQALLRALARPSVRGDISNKTSRLA